LQTSTLVKTTVGARPLSKKAHKNNAPNLLGVGTAILAGNDRA
jgi:hypothetical protein